MNGARRALMPVRALPESMKKLLVFAAIAAVAAFGVWRLSADSPAAKTYQAFADHLARGRESDALALVDGDDARRAVTSQAPERLLPMPMEAVLHVSQTVDWEKPGAEDVTIRATQTIGFDPPGVTSAMGGSMRAEFRHDAIVKRTASGWRVVSFKNVLDHMEERRR